jgi:hypothetical protein
MASQQPGVYNGTVTFVRFLIYISINSCHFLQLSLICTVFYSRHLATASWTCKIHGISTSTAYVCIQPTRDVMAPCSVCYHLCYSQLCSRSEVKKEASLRDARLSRIRGHALVIDVFCCTCMHIPLQSCDTFGFQGELGKFYPQLILPFSLLFPHPLGGSGHESSRPRLAIGKCPILVTVGL